MPANVRAAAIGSKDFSHMPFLSRIGGRSVLVFSRSGVRPRRVPRYHGRDARRVWRLYHVELEQEEPDLNEARPIPTGSEPNEVECSPCVCERGGEVHLSFIGTRGHGWAPVQHRLYRMSGPSLGDLGRPQLVVKRPCYCGFWRPDLMATGSGKDGRIRVLHGDKKLRLVTDFRELGRVSFCAGEPLRLLITGVLRGEMSSVGGEPVHRTIVYDLAARKVLGEVRVQGKPVYKPAICDGAIAFARQTWEGGEGWKLTFGREFELVDTPIRVRVKKANNRLAREA